MPTKSEYLGIMDMEYQLGIDQKDAYCKDYLNKPSNENFPNKNKLENSVSSFSGKVVGKLTVEREGLKLKLNSDNK